MYLCVIFSESKAVKDKPYIPAQLPLAPPLPPPPPPMPDFNLVTKPPKFKRGKRITPRYGAQTNCDALHLVISQLAKEKPKLRHVER